MATYSVEVVVDELDVLPAGATNLRGASGNVIEVVVRKGDFVVRAEQEYGPVVLIVTACRPGGRTIENGVGHSEVCDRIVAIAILAKSRRSTIVSLEEDPRPHTQ